MPLNTPEFGEFEQPLRRPLDPKIREQIADIIESNKGIDPYELVEIFGPEAVHAYYTNPDAVDFDDAEA